MKTKKEGKQKANILLKIVIIAIFLALVAAVINLAPNYIRNEIKDKMNIIINNNDVTTSMKFDAFVDEKDIVYIATKDIANFFDEDIYYDNVYDQIITTSETKVAVLPIDKKEITVNGSTIKIYGSAIKKENEFYLPFSELNDIYNVEIKYNKESNILTVDSLNREQKKANASKDVSVKYKPTIFSKTIDKIEKGDSVIVIESKDNGWYKIRTKLGKIGYTKDITNVYSVREEIENKKQIEGKVSLVWDYYSEYATAPNRQGTKIDGVNVVSPAFANLEKSGSLNINIGETGKKYVEWAHENEYKVWAIVSNNSYKAPTSEVLNDYKKRADLINKIVTMTISYNLDGVNIDFENMNESDKDVFSRFIIELAPRLKEYGKVLSVDVTAPDGSPDWSLCYNRNKIGKIADYVIFMAYDQYGVSSTSAGTTAGADWVEVNIKKFLGQEEVAAEKIILGMPFYTRAWNETSSGVKSTVISMKYVDSAVPEEATRQWNNDLKQYYVEYQKNGTNYKMWIEDENSIEAKFVLMHNYNLAGAAYWQKDMEKEGIWELVEKEINK
jgi:glycoside hydrolase family 18